MSKDKVEAQAIICATGWLPSYTAFFDEELVCRLGLATRSKQEPKWAQLDQSADREICHRFPRLRRPPPYQASKSTLSPFRLYKTMIPIDQSLAGIVFLGHIALGNNFRAAECQALVATAYLDDSMRIPPRAQMEKEVALQVAWCRRRYLGKGALGHWLYFDLIPYTDALLEHLELQSHRKHGLKDFHAPCVAEDLKDIIGEYREKQKQKAA